MRRFARGLLPILLACIAVICSTQRANAQTYVKLNGLYALAGVINPQVEFRISDHSAFQTEIVCSPWESVRGHHFLFGIFMNEYRYYISRRTRGLYAGANAGVQVFNISKPEFGGGKIRFQNRYCKGYGFMFGLCIGYEHIFAERWVVDAFVGMSHMTSWYNGYSMDGVIDMDPHRPDWKKPEHPDPFNGSAEWLPNKAGISIGYMIFNPKKKPL